MQTLTELALTAHRVQGNQQTSFEQVLGWYRRPPCLSIHPRECGRKLAQGIIHNGFDLPDRMVFRHQSVGGHQTEHLYLCFCFPSHHSLRLLRWL